LDRDFELSEENIHRVTGARTKGFRGPGYSISNVHLNVLSKRNYTYDTSAIPNILNPLARMYFFAKSDLSPEEKERRSSLFGNLSDAIRPVDPFKWVLESDGLIEIPVTTMPLLRLPCHFSYILYLSGYSALFGKAYFKFAMGLCRSTGTNPTLLLHPLDFLGFEDEPELAFFPGMNLPRSHKLEMLDWCVRHLQRHFSVVTMADHVADIQQSPRTLRELVPDFPG
jgi:hypothetical protein